MAFIDQKRKAQLAPAIKAVLRKYGLKGSLKVGNHTSLTLTLTEGSLDFIGNSVAVLHREAAFYPNPNDTKGKWIRQAAENMLKNQSMDVNTYHADKAFTGICLKAIQELINAMNTGNHDNSDIQTDYFDVGWYIYLKIGRWNKPYRFTGTNQMVA